MKRLLVRRFESCIESFMKTLDAIILSNKKIKDYYDKEGLIPIYKKGFLPDIEDFIENEDDQKNIQKFEDLHELDKFKEKVFSFVIICKDFPSTLIIPANGLTIFNRANGLFFTKLSGNKYSVSFGNGNIFPAAIQSIPSS